VAGALAAGALLCGPASAAHARASVEVAVLPSDTSVAALARAGLSVGVMSTGVGRVPPEQTYLDVTQGNRVASTLYDLPLASSWDEIVVRAQTAPADLVPGLLATSLVEHGVRVGADPSLRAASVIATDHDGLTRRGSAGPGLAVIPATAGGLPALAKGLRGDDLLIAFSRPSPGRRTVPIGIAGAGFDGDLTSESTRTDGYVLSTDIAPTILRRLGVPIPARMDGEPIRTGGGIDVSAVQDRAERMAAIPDRRAPLLVACLGAWILVALGVNRVVFGLRRVAIAWMALCFAYLPLLLLAGAWLEPGALAEGLLVGLGAAALAALTVRLAWGWRGLAIACGVTTVACAVDVISGSELTKLSLLGPNPVYGARFFGIGNELEALLAVMVPVGVGAGLTAAGGRRTAGGEGGRIGRRRGVCAFLLAGAVATVVFAAGRFGADVGAAIVLPVGGAVAALALPSSDLVDFPDNRPGKATNGGPAGAVGAVVAAPFVALFALALIDLVSGGNAHLTRSILDPAGGNVADAVQRRLELNAHDFARAATAPALWLLLAGIGLSIRQRRRIDAWLRPAPPARAALFGACAAVVAGTLANDSGAAFLALGAVAVGAFLAFAWAQAAEGRKSPGNREIRAMRESAAGKY